MDPSKKLTVLEVLSMNVDQIKEELRIRGATLLGRKYELQERLLAYVKNNNFKIDVDVVPVQPDFLIPEDHYFKDVNASKDLPQVTRKQIKLFLQHFDFDGGSSEGMYNGKFLEYLRYAKDSAKKEHYFKGSVYAEMYKTVTYSVYIRLDSDGMIDRTHCECVAGEGGSAHCKHVVVVLLAIEDISIHGKIILRKSCTEKLQTFHKPSKKYQGSPIKARQMKKANREACIFDPRPESYEKKQITRRAHNLFSPYHSSMPLKCLFPPANPYAVEADHDYLEDSRRVAFLKKMNLLAVSKETINFIEEQTRGQSDNPLWRKYKRGHISASLFGNVISVMKNCEESAIQSLCDRILYPKMVLTKAIQHGILNEDKAIEKFMRPFIAADPNWVAPECGFFISEERPHLGATPDRLWAQLSLLEVKCPYSAKDKPINIYTVPYLQHDQNGELKLKEDHQYMYQIQGQLYCTGRPYCELIVYTKVDIKRITVQRDDVFIHNMVQTLDKFYEEHFLPFLLLNCYYRRYYDYTF